MEHAKFEINLNGRYNGAFRTLVGNEKITNSNGIISNFITDISGKYHIFKNVSVTANIINVFNNTYAASRVPAGIRPEHPFGAYAGFELSL